jgi:type IX secretion system PorP/SprF family membrane protein
MMLHRNILLLLLIVCCTVVYAQQESQYTQFMHNKIMFNPAYAGHGGETSITLLHRQQWMGFERAPQSQLVSVHAPFFIENVGWGLTVSRQSAGILNRWTVSLPYSYQIKLGDDHDLQMGIQGSLRHIGLNFADPSVMATDANDPVIAEGGQGKFIGNAGAGVYWRYGNYYAGLSVPHMFESNIDLSNAPRDIVSRQIAHVYLMAGSSFPLSETVSLMPNVMLKRAQGAPISLDVNMNLMFSGALYEWIVLPVRWRRICRVSGSFIVLPANRDIQPGRGI